MAEGLIVRRLCRGIMLRKLRKVYKVNAIFTNKGVSRGSSDGNRAYDRFCRIS